jgi:ABC-type bacteriocin/lantibiotic exporter with double-glycine peptidase domain
MMNLNGEQVSPIDPSTLPYAQNRAAGPTYILPLSIAASAVFGAVSYFTSYDFTLLTILSPVIFLVVHLYAFHLIRNATHTALRAAHHDARLDTVTLNSISTVNEGHLSPERVARIAAASKAAAGK